MAATYYVSSTATGGGTGTSASPWTLDQAGSGAAGDDKVWVKDDGTYNRSAGLTIANASLWEGYSTTTGDGGRPTLLATATGITLVTMTAGNAPTSLCGFVLDGGGLSSVRGLNASGNYKTVERCRFTRCTNTAVVLGGSASVMRTCEVDHNSAAYYSGVQGGDGWICDGLSLHDNTTGGYYFASGHVSRSASYNNGSGDWWPDNAIECVSAANGNSGFRDANGGGRAFALLGSISQGNGGCGLYGDGGGPGQRSVAVGCSFGGNTSGATQSAGLRQSGTTTLTAAIFTAPASGDFRLTTYGKTIPAVKQTMAAIAQAGVPGITIDSLSDLTGGGGGNVIVVDD